MAIEHARHGEVVDLSKFHTTESAALVKTEAFEAIRLVVKEGKSLPPHKVEGPITVQCLSGRCTFHVEDEPRELGPGAWLYLKGGTTHAVEAAEDSVLLVTILLSNA